MSVEDVFDARIIDLETFIFVKEELYHIGRCCSWLNRKISEQVTFHFLVQLSWPSLASKIWWDDSAIVQYVLPHFVDLYLTDSSSTHNVLCGPAGVDPLFDIIASGLAQWGRHHARWRRSRWPWKGERLNGYGQVIKLVLGILLIYRQIVLGVFPSRKEEETLQALRQNFRPQIETSLLKVT